MQSTITLKADVLQKANQALTLTHFKNVEELIAFLLEEKLQELSRQKQDPIYRVRGKLKGNKGGTALFIKDKQADIERENHV